MKKHKSNFPLSCLQNRHSRKSEKERLEQNEANAARGRVRFYLWERVSAFITDMFMINMPLLYIVVYVVLGSKEAFLENQGAIFLCSVLFGVILSTFFSLNGQSPGYRYSGIKLVCDEELEKIRQDKTYVNIAKTPGFFRAFLRYVIFVFVMCSVFGIFITYLRKDRKPLYDIFTKCSVIAVRTPNIKSPSTGAGNPNRPNSK